MMYLEKLFDLQKAAKDEKTASIGNVQSDPSYLSTDQILSVCRDYSHELKELKSIVTRYMEKNARMYVNLNSLFSFSSAK